MKNKVFLILIYISFLLTWNSVVNAVEELPDNGAKISSAQVIQTKTGTGPWDDNDEPGNDSSENNNIVRSFDQVTWTIENTMVLNNATADSYTGGKIYFEAKLPDVFDTETAKWDLDSMGWIENAQLSDDGLTITGYYQMSKETVTVPGKQTLVFISKILGAPNRTEFQPIIKTWLNGNNEENYVITIPDKVIVSSFPRYNVVLHRNNSWPSERVTINNGSDEITGRMYGYSILLQLYNSDISKGVKGIEYPKEKILLDIDFKMEKSILGASSYIDITNDTNIILWNYSINGMRTGIIEDRKLSFNSSYSFYDERIPMGFIGSTGNRINSIYNSGNPMIRQVSNNKLEVEISDYKFDSIFPKKAYTNINEKYSDNIGCFSGVYFQIFIPENEATEELESQYYLTVNNSNFKATSLSGQEVNIQQVISDDKDRVQHFRYKKGSYNAAIWLYDFNSGKNLSTDYSQGDAYLTKGRKFIAKTIFGQNSANEEKIKSLDRMIKFDGNVFELVQKDGEYYSKSNNLSKFNLKQWFVTKKDGTNWNSQEEMNSSDIDSMNMYENIEDIPNGHLCVGTYFESQGGEYNIAQFINDMYINIFLNIKDTAIINNTYGIVQSNRYWLQELDRTIYSQSIKNGYDFYPKIEWKLSGQNYIKTEYDKDGLIIVGTNNGGYAWGQSLLIVGAEQGLEIKTIDSDGNNKVNYDLNKNENIVNCNILPQITNTDKSVDISGVNLEIDTILPKGLTYEANSCNYGDPTLIKMDDGTTKLVWDIYNCTVNKDIEKINFNVIINENTSNGTQYSINSVIKEKIENSEESKIGNSRLNKRTATTTIQIINLSSHRLYKTMNTPVIEKNGEIHFTLSYKNNTDDTIPDFQLLDILPYNGDSRKTDFTGTYTLDRIVVTQEDSSGNKLSNDNLSILYTNDESARSVTSKDENLGSGWTTVTSENIKQRATAIALKGEVGAQGKVTVDVYLKTVDNKGLDKYVNSATAQVYKATEEITTSNVVSQVVERKIEGIAWEDKNANGIKDSEEEVLKDIELILKDDLGNQVTDVNGNIVSSVRTDENGYYKFKNLPKGNYYISVAIFNSKYDITEKEIGSNSKINSKFNVEARETDEITKLNSIDLPELTMSNVNVGFVKKATSIIVKHQTEEGKDLVELEIIEGRVDEEYTTDKKEFEEYEIKVIPENATGTMEEEQIEVIYVYSLVKGKITIKKVDKNDNTKYLSGAIFKIEKLNNNEVDNEFTPLEKTTGENGIAEFTDLTVGKYRVTEIKAPEGYELAKNTIEVEITKDLREQNITATDRLKLQLPQTGGNGIVIFMITSGIIIIFALVISKIKAKDIFDK